jgi:purine nucleosidase
MLKRLALCAVISTAAVTAAEKIPVVLVADVGIDDAAALLWLLRSPSIELLGIASSFGCHGDVRQTAANAKRLLRAAGAPCVPVHVGSRVAFGNWAPNDDDGKYIHGADGLGDVPPLDGEADLGECDRDVDESLSSAEFIAQTVRERPGEVTIIVTSPATNLALAVVLEPLLPELVKRVLIMGGAIDHPGNVSPLAEANFAHDSRAAKVVVDAFSSDAGDRLVIAPLDVTMRAMATVQQMQQLTSAGVGGSLLAEAWRRYTTNYCQVLKFCGAHAAVHDAHPVAYLLHPSLYENGTRIEPVEIMVTEPLHASNGHSLVDRRQLAKEGIVDDRTGDVTGFQKPRATVLVDVDGDAFLRAFFGTVLGRA